MITVLAGSHFAISQQETGRDNSYSYSSFEKRQIEAGAARVHRYLEPETFGAIEQNSIIYITDVQPGWSTDRVSTFNKLTRLDNDDWVLSEKSAFLFDLKYPDESKIFTGSWCSNTSRVLSEAEVAFLFESLTDDWATTFNGSYVSCPHCDTTHLFVRYGETSAEYHFSGGPIYLGDQNEEEKKPVRASGRPHYESDFNVIPPPENSIGGFLARFRTLLRISDKGICQIPNGSPQQLIERDYDIERDHRIATAPPKRFIENIQE